MNKLLSALISASLILASCAPTPAVYADSIDGTDTPVPTAHGFSVLFKPMSFETNLQEFTWQGLNIIDAMQSYQIAKYSKCFSETGTPATFGFNNPTTHQTVYFFTGFAVLHYLVARGLENLIDEQEPDPDTGFRSYRILQRVYQYSFLAGKTWTIAHNFNIGLDLDHASNHYHTPGCNLPE